jgi:hypothetical protein
VGAGISGTCVLVQAIIYLVWWMRKCKAQAAQGTV